MAREAYWTSVASPALCGAAPAETGSASAGSCSRANRDVRDSTRPGRDEHRAADGISGRKPAGAPRRGRAANSGAMAGRARASSGSGRRAAAAPGASGTAASLKRASAARATGCAHATATAGWRRAASAHAAGTSAAGMRAGRAAQAGWGRAGTRSPASVPRRRAAGGLGRVGPAGAGCRSRCTAGQVAGAAAFIRKTGPGTSGEARPQPRPGMGGKSHAGAASSRCAAGATVGRNAAGHGGSFCRVNSAGASRGRSQSAGMATADWRTPITRSRAVRDAAAGGFAARVRGTSGKGSSPAERGSTSGAAPGSQAPATWGWRRAGWVRRRRCPSGPGLRLPAGLRRSERQRARPGATPPGAVPGSVRVRRRSGEERVCSRRRSTGSVGPGVRPDGRWHASRVRCAPLQRAGRRRRRARRTGAAKFLRRRPARRPFRTHNPPPGVGRPGPDDSLPQPRDRGVYAGRKRGRSDAVRL